MNYHNKRRQKFKKIEEFAHITNFQFRNCEAKMSYVSERLANERAAYRTELEGKTIRSFKCPDCKNWHLTSKPQRNKQ